MHGALASISSKLSALQAIQALGLTTGLQLCLDAGDSVSYSGSGQTWSDRSGNGYDFLRGTTSSAQASDPTFNGTAGQLSQNEYWSFDGGDFFTLNQNNPSWVTNIYKNNAKFILCGWFWFGSIGSQDLAGIWDNTAGDPRWGFIVASTNGLKCQISPGVNLASSATIAAGAWKFVAVRIDEAAGDGLYQINSTQEAFTSTYSSPSSGSNSQKMTICSIGDGAIPLKSGGRLAMFNAWEGTIPSAAQLLAFYNLTRGRFGV